MFISIPIIVFTKTTCKWKRYNLAHNYIEIRLGYLYNCLTVITVLVIYSKMINALSTIMMISTPFLYFHLKLWCIEHILLL